MFFEQRENADLQIALKNALLEKEHVETCMIALSQQIWSQDDIQRDLEAYNNMLKQNEHARDQLHSDIDALNA